jgi:hypothetical protein
MSVWTPIKINVQHIKAKMIYEILSNLHAEHFSYPNLSECLMSREFKFSKSADDFYVSNVFQNNKILATIHVKSGRIKCKFCEFQTDENSISKMLIPLMSQQQQRQQQQQPSSSSSSSSSPHVTSTCISAPTEERHKRHRIDDAIDLTCDELTPNKKTKLNDVPDEENDEKDDNTNCKVCFDGKADCLLLPCKHQGLCGSCSERCRKDKNRCPFCRKKIAQIIKGIMFP